METGWGLVFGLGRGKKKILDFIRVAFYLGCAWVMEPCLGCDVWWGWGVFNFEAATRLELLFLCVNSSTFICLLIGYMKLYSWIEVSTPNEQARGGTVVCCLEPHIWNFNVVHIVGQLWDPRHFCRPNAAADVLAKQSLEPNKVPYSNVNLMLSTDPMYHSFYVSCFSETSVGILATYYVLVS